MTNEEIDRLAAEKVMGWEQLRCTDPDGQPLWDGPDISRIRFEDWHPATDWNCAGMILDRMRELGFDMRILMGHSERFASFWKPGRVTTLHFSSIEPGTSVQRAITIAAIRAMGGEVPNE